MLFSPHHRIGSYTFDSLLLDVAMPRRGSWTIWECIYVGFHIRREYLDISKPDNDRCEQRPIPYQLPGRRRLQLPSGAVTRVMKKVRPGMTP